MSYRHLCRFGIAFLALSLTLFLLSVRPLQAVSDNALYNSSFEEIPPNAPNDATAWSIDSYTPDVTMVADATTAYFGRRSVKITTSTPNDARWIQTVAVKPNTNYRLSGWIKTENVAHTIQSEDAGANLCILGEWTRTTALLGTNDWRYVSLSFNSGDRTEIIICARLGFWSGITTGTAWFDNIQLTPIDTSGPVPGWQMVTLIYRSTDFTYTTDTNGSQVQHHVVSQMSDTEVEQVRQNALNFANIDIPALSSGLMTPQMEIVYPAHPLTKLSPIADAWWPASGDVSEDVPPNYDAALVVWDGSGVDLNTGNPVYLHGPFGGLTPAQGTARTYSTQIVELAGADHRNGFKHEWGHSLVAYFEATGAAPKPPVDNHINWDNPQYVNCPTGKPYVMIDETTANPIPNSIYNNQSGFTHDYYSGQTALREAPTRCLGIPRSAWVIGGPTSQPPRNNSVGDWVWQDQNGNGLQDTGEPGIASLSLSLHRSPNCSDSTPLARTQSDGTGFYWFSNVPSGTYSIHLDNLPNNFQLTTLNQGQTGSEDSPLDSDATAAGCIETLQLTSDRSSYDIGLIGQTAAHQQLLLSSTSSGRLPNLTFNNEDIVAFDLQTDQGSIFFDGGDVGIHEDVDAFTLLSDGSLLISLNNPERLPGVGKVDDSDILKFVPSKLGATTVGRFERYLNGADVGLTTNEEDIDAIAFDDQGRLVVSTIGYFNAGGATGRDEDLFARADDKWVPLFDGSDVGLTSNEEDIKAAWINFNPFQIYLANKGAYSVDGLRGDADDVFICTPQSLGPQTKCSFQRFWNGDDHRFGSEQIDGIVLGTLPASLAQVLDASAIDSSEMIEAEENTEIQAGDDEVEDAESIQQIFLPVVKSE